MSRRSLVAIALLVVPATATAEDAWLRLLADPDRMYNKFNREVEISPDGETILYFAEEIPNWEWPWSGLPAGVYRQRLDGGKPELIRQDSLATRHCWDYSVVLRSSDDAARVIGSVSSLQFADSSFSFDTAGPLEINPETGQPYMPSAISPNGASVARVGTAPGEPPSQQFDDGRVVSLELPRDAALAVPWSISADDRVVAGRWNPEAGTKDWRQSLVIWRDGAVEAAVSAEPGLNIWGPMALNHQGDALVFTAMWLPLEWDFFEALRWRRGVGISRIGVRHDWDWGFFEVSGDLRTLVIAPDELQDPTNRYAPRQFFHRFGEYDGEISEVLADLGFDLQGGLPHVTGISHDGQTIAGRIIFPERTDACALPLAVPFVANIPFRMDGDANRDFIIDGADLGLVLSAWGTDDEAADVTENGIVDSLDLGMVLAEWGNEG